tara:strand:+ start:739 stop:1707 length:969 start_codon:yes stop_codon:yes gene_type:complete
MTDEEFRILQFKTSKLITNTFNKSTLKRTITSKAAKAHLNIFNKQIEKLLATPNLTKSQYLDLHNQIESQKSQYRNKVIKKDKITTQEKDKIFRKNIKKQLIKKQEVAPISRALRKIPITSTNVTNNLINSLGGFVEGKNKVSTGTAVTPYDAIKVQSNKVNFNLKGFSLFENAAYNSKIHGISNTIQELDEGVKNKKISLSEANKIKSTLQDDTVNHKLHQLGTSDQVKQFNRPEYQKSFKIFLKGAFNKYMKVIPVVGPIFQMLDMKKEYEQIQSGDHPMFPSPEKVSAQVYKRGGKVKPKPYAMGGKVYSNSVRKPKFK